MRRINRLPENMVGPVAIRDKQNSFAVRRPGRWPIVPVIQSEAPKRAQLLTLSHQFRHVNVRLELAAKQSQALSVTCYTDAGDRSLIVCDAGGRAVRPSCMRI